MNIKKLESWYHENHRLLPFRGGDPYQIWVSEIMLQQTQVETVLPFFERFMKAYPHLVALSKASDEDLKRNVQGLGYYRRFSNMLKAAKIMVEQHQKTIPDHYEDLIKLPGIGAYTAGAILSIAYRKPYAATDGNVIRVLTRLYGIFEDMSQQKHKKIIEKIHQDLIEQATPEIYTQAVMELGALVCRPQQPKCQQCPLSDTCYAFHHDKISELPLIEKKSKQKTLHWMTCVMVKDDYIYLRKRTESLLNGMYEYPQFSFTDLDELKKWAKNHQITFKKIDYINHIKHVFSHQIWEMDVYLCVLKENKSEDWIEIPMASLKTYPMATAHRKIDLSFLNKSKKKE